MATKPQCKKKDKGSGAICDRKKGHKGMHHGIVASQIVVGLEYDVQWTDGFKPGKAAFINKYGSAMSS